MTAHLAAGPPPDESLSASEVARLLVQHGHRWTRPRRIVVDAVLTHDRPFTAEQLVAEIHARHPWVGRSTIYRTLDLLASLDVLSRLLTAEGHPAYVVGAPGHRHHLVCTRCGATVSFTDCPVDALTRDLAHATDFAIQGHRLELFGLCPNCQSRQSLAP